MDINIILQSGSIFLTIIGVLAFFVSVITEFTKKWKFLNRIPTDVQVLAISILISILSIVTYIQIKAIAMEWYYLAGAAAMGFLVAFVAMYGWEKLSELWKRFVK